MSGFTKELDEKTHVFEPMMYREWPAAKFFEKPVKLADAGRGHRRPAGRRAGRGAGPRDGDGLTMSAVEELIAADGELTPERLIPLLQQVQAADGFVSQQAMATLADGSGHAGEPRVRRGHLLQPVPLRGRWASTSSRCAAAPPAT